jgi:hypothetical protein
MKLITHLIWCNVKNSGAIPLLPLYVFMVWTGTALSTAVTVNNAGIVLFPHAALQKYCTYLDYFIWEIHINICDVGSVLPHVITFTPYF